MKRIILFLSLMMAFSVPSFARERIPTKKEVNNVNDTEQDGTIVNNFSEIDKGNYLELPYEDGNKYVMKMSKEDFIEKLKNELKEYYPSKYKNGDTKLREDFAKYINEELVKLCKEPLKLKSDDIVYDDGATYFILEDNDGNEYPIDLDINDYKQELSPKIDLGIIDNFDAIRDNEVFKNHLINIDFEDNAYPDYNVRMEDNGNFYIYFSKYKNGLTHNYKIQVDFLKRLNNDDLFGWRGLFSGNYFYLEKEDKKMKILNLML